MIDLKQYIQRFNDLKAQEQDYINNNQVGKYNKALSTIMADMERAFNIPLVDDDNFNNANPEIIALYRDISDSRIF